MYQVSRHLNFRAVKNNRLKNRANRYNYRSFAAICMLRKLASRRAISLDNCRYPLPELPNAMELRSNNTKYPRLAIARGRPRRPDADKTFRVLAVAGG